MRWKWRRLLLVGAVGLTAGGAFGCAEEREPINRVQANALSKSFFVGDRLLDTSDDPEFWTQGTLVDVGYGANQDGLFTSTYAQPASRIKWVITEDLLLGRLTYERIDDTDGKGAGAHTDDGIIVVAFRIQSHFDIRRAYNPSTGEELNIIEENMSDRPWYEREYFRVDWSRNLNVDSYDFDTLSMVGVFGGVTYESLAYDVRDPYHEDAPYFDPESGYFDVTNKAFARPQLIDLSSLGWGLDTFPACFLDADFSGGTAPSGNCNPVELTVRHSFRRVVNKDYEPAEWDGHRFQAYGAFTAERMGYARNYGMVDTKWHRFITRYNIWERSHYYQKPETMDGPVECYTPTTTPVGADPHRDTDGDGTEDECAAVGRGSRCDTFTQRCTLPFRDRKTVPQAWYYTNKSNLEYWEGTEWATHEWDVALRHSVQSAKYAECTRTSPGKDEATRRTDCNAAHPMIFGQMDVMPDMIAIAREVDNCRNKMPAYKDTDCSTLAANLLVKRGYAPGDGEYEGIKAIADMDEMIVLCHSPVLATDHPSCGALRLPEGVTPDKCEAAKDRLAAKDFKAETAEDQEDQDLVAQCRTATVRMGDLRYHQVNVMTAPQTPSPWGIYTDTEDPLTGEKVAASINIWSHINDLWSQGIIDKLRYIKGELQTADITEGTFVKDWAQAAESAEKGSIVPPISAAELNQKIADYAGLDVEAYKKLLEGNKAAADKFDLSQADQKKLRNLALGVRDHVRDLKADASVPSENRAMYDARRKLAAGTPFEAQLITKAMMQYAGVDSNLVPSDVKTELASTMRVANASVQREIRSRKEIALANRGACMMQEAPAPNSMTGLAESLERKFGAFNPADSKDVQLARAEAMRKYLAQRAQYAVIIHEMGHSVGLRHNFVSSSDAFGFRPQYWQLRTKNLTVGDENSEICKDIASPTADVNGNGVPDNEECIGPRYFDPVSEEERKNLIWMFMHSSVMEYAGEATQDLLGLGVYDFAAARMFYGDAAAVFQGPEFKFDRPLGTPGAVGGAMLDKMDSFGGLLGFLYQNPDYDDNQQFNINTNNYQLHYSQLVHSWKLMNNCRPIEDVNVYKPLDWDDATKGTWDPLLDGMMVQVDGQYSKCSQPKVDYVRWDELGPRPTAQDDFNSRPMGTDPYQRVRVPYGFGTDNWADLGNVAVYRHDNGADPYEQFSFMIAETEMNHIFDNYRRNRNSFSVRNAANRILSRYSEKMRDGAKGLTLMRNLYSDAAFDNGFQPAELWNFIVTLPFMRDGILTSGMVFDHFTRQMARPESGPHFLLSEFSIGSPQPPPGKELEEVLRSSADFVSLVGGQPKTRLIVPNGATGYFGDIGIGGKPLENALANDKGEYDSQYTLNAGSYYDKLNTAMLFTESVDNFISASRTDFLDPRYRASSLADLFPEGYRRWLANNLTGDDFIKGARVELKGTKPKVDADKYPSTPLGWTSWWPLSGPEVCFPREGTSICNRYGDGSGPFDPLNLPAMAIDPQVGWEQQKFLIAHTMVYLPENQKQTWLNMLRLWEKTEDADPPFENRIELHDPSGAVYVAKTFGKENIFGHSVQKGIAARVLEYANELLDKAYVTTPVTLNGTTWYVPVVDATGKAVLKGGATDCGELAACVEFADYTSVIVYLRQAVGVFQYADPSQKGLFNL